MHKKELIDCQEIIIRFSDTDAMGVVWYGNYLKFFEDGRESFGRTFGLNYLLFHHYKVFTPIVSVKCFYQKSLHYGQNAIIFTKYIDSDAAKIIFEYEIRETQENQVIAIGESIQVFTTLNQELILTPPHFFLDWKNKIFGDEN